MSLSLELPLDYKVLFRGKEMPVSLEKKITSMQIDMSIDQITELTIEIADPNFEVLKSGLYDIDTPVTCGSMDLVVSVLETTDSGGQGGVTIKCRPRTVRNLKLQRGLYSHTGSASTYVAAECKMAGAKKFIQVTPTRPVTLARLLPQQGMWYTASDYPSAWTTMQQFAQESQFLLFEYEGMIYFAQPTFIVSESIKTKNQVVVDWYKQNGNQPMNIPKFRRSVDSDNITSSSINRISTILKPFVEVSVQLPLSRVNEVRLGHALIMNGFPYFAGTYMITAISFPVRGGGVINVTASTVVNPFPQIASDAPSSAFEALTLGKSTWNGQPIQGAGRALGTWGG